MKKTKRGFFLWNTVYITQNHEHAAFSFSNTYYWGLILALPCTYGCYTVIGVISRLVVGVCDINFADVGHCKGEGNMVWCGQESRCLSFLLTFFMNDPLMGSQLEKGIKLPKLVWASRFKQEQLVYVFLFKRSKPSVRLGLCTAALGRWPVICWRIYFFSLSGLLQFHGMRYLFCDYYHRLTSLSSGLLGLFVCYLFHFSPEK